MLRQCPITSVSGSQLACTKFKIIAPRSNGTQYTSILIASLQVAAGGAAEEEAQAVAMLLRALELDPALADSYDNVMRVADLLRATQNASFARAHYALAAAIEPLRWDHRAPFLQLFLPSAAGFLLSSLA
jgi:hypothetical protein